MKKVLFASLAVATLAAYAEVPKVDFSKMSVEERKQFVYRRLGGYIEKPGMVKGKIVIVNAQKRAADSVIADAITNVNSKLNYCIEFKRGAFALPKPNVEGDASLFVIDDPAMPALLSAPEDRWTMVNVARLSEGEGAKEPFFKARTAKELTRGFCLLCGTQDSNYKNSLLGCKTKPEDLDRHIDCRLPIDIPRRFGPYLEGYGIKPRVILPYRQACMEGWAPQPTNELQKTVWDEVRALPQKPMKIEFDPKKGR